MLDYNNDHFVSTCVVFTAFYLHGVFRPDLFSWDRVVKMSPTERLEHAFSQAQMYLGIEKLLDPEGIVQWLILILILLHNFGYLKSSVFCCCVFLFCLFFFRRNYENWAVFFRLKHGASHFVSVIRTFVLNNL